jgi:CRP-like cAMP-binding protein
VTRKPRRIETWHPDDEVVEPLLRAMHLGRRRVYRQGDFLYSQGEVDPSFYLVLRGHVLVSSMREDGSEFTLETMGHRAVCGEAAAFDGKPSFTSAFALDEVEVIAFRADETAAAFATHPEIAVALLRIASRKQRIIAVRANYLASLKPQARIAELLHRLAEQYGLAEQGATAIGVSLTHQQIAALTGTTRVTVTRTLKRLREQGDIAVEDNRVLVPDMKRLMQVAARR